MTSSLIESELFGYEAGAFTGASKEGKQGKFEQANGGTLFLDEIGDMPLPDQVSLLRVLQNKEVVRVGGNRTIKINVRIIAATNRDIEQLVREKKFRSDLYYRLNVFSINIPSPGRTKRGYFSIGGSFYPALQCYAKQGNERHLRRSKNRFFESQLARQYSRAGKCD